MTSSEQIKNETPNLVDLLLTAIRANQLEVNTCMPATIVEYDSATLTATVQPSFRRRTQDDTYISRPTIQNVPVVFPRSGVKGVYFPIAKGDPCLLVFSQRSLDTWLGNGGEIELSDPRLHNINDAIAIPGLGSTQDTPSPAPSDDTLEVRGDKVFMGDKNQATTPIAVTPGTATGIDAGGGGALNIPAGELDVVSMLGFFMELMLNAHYGVGTDPTSGFGGKLDLSTTTALTNLRADLEKLRP